MKTWREIVRQIEDSYGFEKKERIAEQARASMNRARDLLHRTFEWKHFVAKDEAYCAAERTYREAAREIMAEIDKARLTYDKEESCTT